MKRRNCNMKIVQHAKNTNYRKYGRESEHQEYNK